MIIKHLFDRFKIIKIKFVRIACFFISSFFLSSLALSLSLASSPAKNYPEPNQPEIKKKAPKPGEKILIAIVSPELEELLFSEKEKIIPVEIEWREELQEAERAELKKRLEELKKEKDILIGDFYGINQLGYRYAMVFDRLGYIRYRLKKVNEEIAEIEKKIKN